MPRPKCRELFQAIKKIKRLRVQYNSAFQFYPENKDCLNLKKEITELVDYLSEASKIKWAEYESLSQIELEPMQDRMDEAILTADNKVVSRGDRVVTIYHVGTGKCLKQFVASNGSLSALAQLPSGFVVATEDGMIKTYNTRGGAEKVLRAHKKKDGVSISRMLPLKDGSLITVMPGAKSLITVWDMNKGKIKQAFETNLVLDKFGHQLFELSSGRFALTMANAIEIYDTRTGEVKRMIFSDDFIPGPGRIILVDSISENEIEIFYTTAPRSGSLIVNIETGEMIKTEKKLRPRTHDMILTSDGSMVAFSVDEVEGAPSLRKLDFWDSKENEMSSKEIDRSVKLIKETKDHNIVTLGVNKKVTVWGMPEKDNPGEA